jgi:adenylate kinase
MNIILLGIQGSGKSTQGNLLSEKYNLPYLSSGHILRAMSREKTRVGRYIKETINAGVLVPDNKMTEIMEEYLERDEYKDGWILDGYPRTDIQARSFKHKIAHAIFIDVSDKEALWRLAYREDEDREDATLKAIKKRIELFHKFTKPVLSYYRRRKLLIEVNGEMPIKKVQGDIIRQMKK